MRSSLLSILLLACGVSAHAQLANLPDLYDPQGIGRVTLYPSVQPYSWLLPTAFETDFSCTESRGKHQTCTIRVFNRLNAFETETIEKAQKQGLKVVPMSDVDNSVVNGIMESFEIHNPKISGQAQSMATLRLSDGRMPYGSYMFRATTEDAQEILQTFLTGQPLGIFRVRFLVNAQRTLSYMALEDGACLKKHLSSAGAEGLWFYEVNKLLDKVIAQCKPKHIGFAGEEVTGYLRPHLRKEFFSYSYWRGYELKHQALKPIGDRYEIVNTSEANIRLSCASELPLAAGAVVKTFCEEGR